MRLAAALLGVLLAALVAPASLEAAAPPPAPGSAPPPQGEARGDLRQALRDYYVHALVQELGMEPARVPQVASRVDALIEAQRGAVRGRMENALQVRSAADGAGDPAAALGALERSERESQSRVAAARKALLDELSPRQAVRFLAFEGRFRQRVRELVAGGPALRPDGPGPDGPDTPGQGGPDARGPGGAPRRPGAPPQPPGDIGPAAGGPDEGDDGDVAADMKETIELLFVHRLRQRLALDDARTLALLPKIEAFIDARFESEQDRRALVRRLRAAADDGSMTDAALSALIKESRDLEASGPQRMSTARRGVLAALSPKEGAQFLVFAFQFEREARRRLMGAAALAHGDDGAGPRMGRERGEEGGPPGGGGRRLGPRWRRPAPLQR